MSGTLAGMTDALWPPDLVQVWFNGGTAGGAIRCVPCGEDGMPPGMLAWRADGVFVGASAGAAPA